MSEKIKTPQERYRDRNREKWNEYEKERAKQKYQTDEEYRNKKKEDSLNYYHRLKDEGKSFQKYRESFKENHPNYHKDYNKQYNKPYYENNKDRILKMVGEKVLCEYCNKQVRKDYLHKHIQRLKHIHNTQSHEHKQNELQ
jgi:hypothetical protein